MTKRGGTVSIPTRSIDRRAWLRRLASRLPGAATAWLIVQARVANAAGSAPDDPERQRFMAEATRMRAQAIDSGDQAFGAIIVKSGEIVGYGPSRVVTNGDPTGHAEIEAIRDACRRLKTRNLSGCTMYGTSAPCAMCETAAYWAQIDTVRFGLEDAGSHAPRYGGC